MRKLLNELDALDIFGINLLEFCFPRHNWLEFERRGFRVKNPPFPVLYDYRYAGGLPIAESEALALELLSYALNQHMTLGVHYCSLENKHRDEIYQLNVPYATALETYQLDPEDFFLKTVVAFGEDAHRLRQELTRVEVPFEDDPTDGSIQFNPASLEMVPGLSHEITLYSSYNVIEPRSEGAVVRELKLIELPRNYQKDCRAKKAERHP
jgi:hypothetical protein